MLTLSANGRLTRTPELRNTDGQDRHDRVGGQQPPRSQRRGGVRRRHLWDVQATVAAKHLVKGQAVALSGRLEPRAWKGRDGEQRIALEVHGVEIEYGAKPRGRDEPASEPVDDIPA